MNSAIEDIDVELRKAVGRAFAIDCCRFELWDVDGPTPELRERVTSGDLPTEVLVLMRVALDLYDGSGGNLSFAEAAAMLAHPAGTSALFFLAEYINMITVSAFATTLFLGGWRAPGPITTFWAGANSGWWPVQRLQTSITQMELISLMNSREPIS